MGRRSILALLLFRSGYSVAAKDGSKLGLRRTEDDMAAIRSLVADNSPLPKIGSFLSDLWKLSPSGLAAEGQIKGFFERDYGELTSLLHVDDEAMVPVDIVGTNLDMLLEEAESIGFQRTALCSTMASGKVPVSSLQTLSELKSLALAKPVLAMSPPPPQRDFSSFGIANIEDSMLSGLGSFQPGFGSVVSEGVFSLNAKKIVFDGALGVNGHGITVGVLSDSFDTSRFPITAADDIASGDLPKAEDILILAEFDDPFIIDEGRAMMQHIHDLAPEAKLAFHTAFEGECSFANGIRELSLFSDVISDDIIYLTEPMFQDGEISQAVDEVSRKGVPSFSAVGNNARQSYEGPFIASGLRGPSRGNLHNFNPDPEGPVDVRQSVRLDPGSAIVLNWDQPYASVSGAPGSMSDLDMYLLQGSTLLARGTTNNIGGDPIEIMAPNLQTSVEADLLIEWKSGPGPTKVKVIIFDGDFLEYQTFSSTAFGHTNSAKGASVGASWWRETPYFGFNEFLLEPYSSAGGLEILFDTNGNRLEHPEVRKQPVVVGPDFGSTTFFIQRVERWPHPVFPGTSAAAPHVAAVAALILEKAKQLKKKLHAEDVYAILAKTAVDMKTPGCDFDSGYGHVDATAAINEVKNHKVVVHQKEIAAKAKKGGK